MDACVVIPTHGRPDSLAAVLDAVDSPAIVVENGTRNARQVVERAGARYEWLPEANASAARNLGAERCSAEIVAFLDDDVVPKPGWLDRLIAPIRAGEADATVGRIRVSDVVPDSARAVFVETDRVIDPSRPFLAGGAMAMNRGRFLDLDGFDPELGPGALGCHEDVLLGLRLTAAGGRIRYVPDAEAVHHIPADRVSRRALLAHAERQGRSEGWVMHHWLGSNPTYLRLRLLRSTVLCAVNRNREHVQRRARERQLLRERGAPRKYASRGSDRVLGAEPPLN